MRTSHLALLTLITSLSLAGCGASYKPEALPEIEYASADTLNNLVAMDDGDMKNLRGGFDRNGLQASFGFSRILMLNGEIQAIQTLSFGELSITGRGLSQADQIQAIQESVMASPVANIDLTRSVLINNGQTIGLVLQNAADGQLIQQINRIDITVSGLPLIRQINLPVIPGS